MSSTGVDSLDHSVDKTNAWLAGVERGFDTHNRRLAYRVTRAWLHSLRDRLTVEVAAHFAAQLPDLLRGVFYEGWRPSHVPEKYGRAEYLMRFARDARIHDSDVAKAAGLVTAVVRQHVSAGAVDEAFALLPADLRELLDHTTAETVAGRSAP
jgi:uncharacterized protein (DUF2267 family)